VFEFRFIHVIYLPCRLLTRKPYEVVNLQRGFTPVIRALYISWVFIMVHLLLLYLISIFRIVEFASGWNGPVYTHERYFYIFDASVLYVLSCFCTNYSVPATSVFLFFFHVRYGVWGISNSRGKLRQEN